MTVLEKIENTTLRYCYPGQKLKDVPQTFRAWLLENTDNVAQVKACDVLISKGEYAGRRIDRLNAGELEWLILDDEQCLYLHRLAKEKLDHKRRSKIEENKRQERGERITKVMSEQIPLSKKLRRQSLTKPD